MGKTEWRPWNRWNTCTHAPLCMQTLTHVCTCTQMHIGHRHCRRRLLPWLAGPLYPQPLLLTFHPPPAFVKTWLLPEDTIAQAALSAGNYYYYCFIITNLKIVFPKASGPGRETWLSSFCPMAASFLSFQKWPFSWASGARTSLAALRHTCPIVATTSLVIASFHSGFVASFFNFWGKIKSYLFFKTRPWRKYITFLQQQTAYIIISNNKLADSLVLHLPLRPSCWVSTCMTHLIPFSIGPSCVPLPNSYV